MTHETFREVSTLVLFSVVLFTVLFNVSNIASVDTVIDFYELTCFSFLQ